MTKNYSPTATKIMKAAFEKGATMDADFNKIHDRKLSKSMVVVWWASWVISWSILAYLTYLIVK
jgi:hypothetical protein